MAGKLGEREILGGLRSLELVTEPLEWILGEEVLDVTERKFRQAHVQRDPLRQRRMLQLDSYPIIPTSAQLPSPPALPAFRSYILLSRPFHFRPMNLRQRS